LTAQKNENFEVHVKLKKKSKKIRNSFIISKTSITAPNTNKKNDTIPNNSLAVSSEVNSEK
jgi:hypothetical protein